MKTTRFIVSVAVTLVALARISAAWGAPAEGGGEPSTVVVPEPASPAPDDATPASTPRVPFDPPPIDPPPFDPPSIDPSSSGFGIEGEPCKSCRCPGDPVATHLTATGSGDRGCPHCGGSHGCRSRAPGLRGWWLGRVKPCLQRSHWGYANLFEEPPAGAAIYAHKRAQVMRAMCARMALYRYDFHDEASSEAAEL
ncbi:MAG: hypothetical protein ACYTG0_26030, partial [Planctomycetota bacterium]